MSQVTLLAGLVLIAVTMLAIAQPFINQRRNAYRDSTEQKQRDELLTNYERVLATIRDLDEDHQTGKLAEATYQRERQYWTERGITLLQQLETAIDTQPTALTQPTDEMDDAIERAIAEYREVRA